MAKKCRGPVGLESRGAEGQARASKFSVCMSGGALLDAFVRCQPWLKGFAYWQLTCGLSLGLPQDAPSRIPRCCEQEGQTGSMVRLTSFPSPPCFSAPCGSLRSHSQQVC